MKTVEIGSFGGISICVKTDDLLQLAARQELNDHMKRIIEDNNKLVYKLGLTIEALNKILDKSKSAGIKSDVSEYSRRVCQNVLKQVEG